MRHYGATYTNYTGKPLAYLLAQPERADDADNTLRVAFGNEGSPEVVDGFARRFGLEVIDAYGATEGGVAVNRDAGTPPGALGLAPDHVQVVDDDGNEKPRAEIDEHGRVTNAEESVGEIVNTQGVGPFEGYYKNDEATAKTTRFGWYWSGDLGYKDAHGFLYFAGRNADWIRVDGENFPAGPIEATLRQAPGVVLAAVYGVPDDQAGDQAMAGLVVADEATFDIDEFARWLDAQEAIGPKWRPRYVRILRDPPTTGTNKIVKRTLVHQKFRHDRTGGDPCFVRARGEERFRPFTEADEAALYDVVRALRPRAVLGPVVGRREVLVVTGAGGMGEAVARRLGGGRAVVLADFNEAQLERLAAALRGDGYDVHAVRVDVSSAGDVTMLAETAAGLGTIRCVVHTAGVSPVQATSQQIVDIDVVGTARVLDAFEPHVAAGHRRRVHREHGRDDDDARTGRAAAARGHTDRRARGVAGARSGIDGSRGSRTASRSGRTTCACKPRRSRGAGAAGAWCRSARASSRRRWVRPSSRARSVTTCAAMIEMSGTGRIGTPDDIAAAVEFLVSPAASFITGTDLLVDGGVIAALGATPR